jgi:hypothetical protein
MTVVHSLLAWGSWIDDCDRLRAGSTGQPLGLLRQQRVLQRDLRVGLAQHRSPPAPRSYNGVIQPRTGRDPRPFPQVNSYFQPYFFRGK